MRSHRARRRDVVVMGRRTSEERIRGAMAKRVAQKWGFGMAPPKASTSRARTVACEKVLDLLRPGSTAGSHG